jgi:hypothetical protein
VTRARPSPAVATAGAGSALRRPPACGAHPIPESWPVSADGSSAPGILVQRPRLQRTRTPWPGVAARVARREEVPSSSRQIAWQLPNWLSSTVMSAWPRWRSSSSVACGKPCSPLTSISCTQRNRGPSQAVCGFWPYRRCAPPPFRILLHHNSFGASVNADVFDGANARKRLARVGDAGT